MKFAVIGAGNTGHAVSAYLASKGAACTLYTRSAEKADILNRGGITAEGDLDGNFPVRATTSEHEALDGAEYVIIMTTANAHRAVAEQFRPYFLPGQKIIVFNSNWGALEFKQVLGGDIAEKHLVVSETSAQLFISKSKAPGHVHVKIKSQTAVAATDPAETAPLVAALKDIFPQFTTASSIVETTMSTTNPVIHVPIMLFNAARAENAQPFLFYAEGASHAAVDLVVHLDQERIAVARALGCDIPDILTGINSFWTIKYDTLYDALTKNETYQHSVGPQTLNHRYLTEDVPFGIDPIRQIGDLLGVETPYTDALMAFLRCAFSENIVGTRTKFCREDFADYIK